MRKIFFATIAIAIFIVSYTVYVKKSGKIETTKKVESIIITPIGYAGGVYYFSCVDESFAKSLSFFIINNKKNIKEMTDRPGVCRNKVFYVVVEVEK